MKSGIYIIKNIVNNKVYIGSAVDIQRRWRRHRTELKKGKHHSMHLQAAWNIYGKQSFKFEIIEQVSNPLHLLSYEQVYLDYYKCYKDEHGYNICKVAGSAYGLKHTEEAKQKISKAHSGKKYSEETRKKISEAKTGRKVSEETKKRMSEASKRRPELIEFLRKINTGRKHKEESKKKISEGQRRRQDNKCYSFDKDKNKYRVRVYNKHIGYFLTEEEAIQAVSAEKSRTQHNISS
jgi:group I intron endonuclease